MVNNKTWWLVHISLQEHHVQNNLQSTQSPNKWSNHSSTTLSTFFVITWAPQAAMCHNLRPTSVLYVAHQKQLYTIHKINAVKCIAQFRCWHYTKVHTFLFHLHSKVLRWISVRLFLPQEPLVHVTALWWFLVIFCPPPSSNKFYLRTKAGKTKLFYWTTANKKNDHLWVCESSGYWCFKQNQPPPAFIIFCIKVFVLPAEGTFQLLQLAITSRFQIKLLVCSVHCVCDHVNMIFFNYEFCY